MATYSEQLAEVNAAISAILSGEVQSYKFAGREITKIDIGVLLRERARLEPLAAREATTGGGIRHRSGYLER